MRTVQSLNGVWDYRVGRGMWAAKTVPFSSLPVGESECRLVFDREVKGARCFLIFEGITYAADVVLNGEELGQMLPYCEYRFDVTGFIRDTGNELTVRLRDIDPVFGPSEGWENYGGIIRPVWLLCTAEDFITDVVWMAEPSEDLSAASCRILAEAALPTEGAVIRWTLIDPSGRVCAGGPVEGGSASFMLDAPALWSPDRPALYTLTVSVFVGGTEVDRDERRVGIKSFSIRGRRFCLNGEPLFLVGVCRHDLWGGQGHTMTEEQMRRDMTMIKAQGANYVRLVHYPHNRRILELADELGLMVSEEPGLWWSDMKNEVLCRDSLEVLRRTVVRDRSHVSVAFWLAFNECVFTAEYLRDAARVCRENDPTRPVSGANCMSIEMTKQFFTENGFDFYTMHPYADNTGRMWESAEKLNDKPLVFTEWGGYMVWRNDDLFARFIRDMVTMWRNTGDKPVLAGAALWCWSDIYEFSRMEPACRDGILCEGLTDIDRKPHSHLPVFRREFSRLYEEPSPEYRLVLSDIMKDTSWTPVPVESGCGPDDRAWRLMEERSREPVTRFFHPKKRERHIRFGPVLQKDGLPSGCLARPAVITEGERFFAVSAEGDVLRILGNVSMPHGYPVGGVYGEKAGAYLLHYADGVTETVPLRNGYEITTAFLRWGPSRLDPVAACAPRAMTFHYDYDSESYAVNAFDVPLRHVALTGLTVRVSDPAYCLLLYGLAVRKGVPAGQSAPADV